MLSGKWLYWDPNREAFYIPYLHWPVLWYGILFAIGFAIGYYIFTALLRRYLYNYSEITEKDISNWNGFIEFLNCPKNEIENVFVKAIVSRLDPDSKQFLKKCKIPSSNLKAALLLAINRLIDDDKLLQYEEYRSIVQSKISKMSSSSVYLEPKRAAVRFLLDSYGKTFLLSIRNKAYAITDRLAVYIIIGTVVGARLGHMLFYEKPSEYLRHPLEILKVWEGGLASHGAALALILAIFLFSLWAKRHYFPKLGWITLMDLLAIPTAFVGCCIRIGNFFNQEILGTPSTVPWAIVFGHPADGSFPVPRHPAQLYESLFYLIVFLILWVWSYRPSVLLRKGRLIGSFFILVFGFRFLIEFLKIEQSSIVGMDSFLVMGQYLSIPFILIGVLFFFWRSPLASKKPKSSQ